MIWSYGFSVLQVSAEVIINIPVLKCSRDHLLIPNNVERYFLSQRGHIYAYRSLHEAESMTFSSDSGEDYKWCVVSLRSIHYPPSYY